VTTINIYVWLIFIFLFVLSGWINTFNVFFIDRNILPLESERAETDTVQQTNRIIAYIAGLPISLTTGVLFDTIGRRKPVLFASALASVALIAYPFNTNEYVYYLINLLIVPFSIAGDTVPFIPDLIKEES